MMRNIDKIIIHCTATPEGKDYTVDEIRGWHVRGNGWKDIGYHFVVHLDGEVSLGRPVNQIGAHCKGQNASSIGIAYVGGCTPDGKTPRDTRTPAQKKALRNLVAILKHSFPGATVHCHNEFANKACPSFKIQDF